MKLNKDILYWIGAIILILKIFFRDNFSSSVDKALWVMTGVLFLLIVFSELFSKKK